MGSVYAGLMASAGHEVFAVTAWADHAEAMQRSGLRVEGFSGDRTVPVTASVTTDGIGPVDLVVLATKAHDVEEAARSALPLLRPQTQVQAMQNGLGSGEKVAAIVGAERTAVGVGAGFGAALRAPGHVHHNGMDKVHFGPFGGLSSASLEAAAGIWRDGGFSVDVHDDVERLVWRKLLVNVTVSGTCCLTGLTVGQALTDPEAWPIARGCMLEAVAVAGAKGISLDVGDPIEHVRRIAGKVPDALPSMLQDHIARRRSEIDVINGGVVREGARVNVPTPINATVTALVKAREAYFA
jgi:2-dehydropantoate 2-reductase